MFHDASGHVLVGRRGEHHRLVDPHHVAPFLEVGQQFRIYRPVRWRRPGLCGQCGQILSDFGLLAVAELHAMIRRPHQPVVVNDGVLIRQTDRSAQVHGLRDAQPAAQFLGRSAPAERVLVVISLQCDLGLVAQNVPAAPGVNHRVALDAHFAQRHYLVRFNQDAQAFQDFHFGKVGALGQGSQVARTHLVRDGQDDVRAGAGVQHGELFQHLGGETAVAAAGIGISHLAAAQGILG